MTMRLRISTEPMRAGVSRMFMPCPGCGAARARLHAGYDFCTYTDAREWCTADPELRADFRATLGLAHAGALDLAADAPPLPLGLDQAWMDAVDLHAVALAEIGEALAEGGNGGVHRAADGEMPFRLAPAGATD